MVAMMCEALQLRPGQNVLEVGTGSGYHAAVVARLIAPGHLTTIEFDPILAHRAREALARQGVANVTVRPGDGAFGAPELAPFDRIYLACTAPAFPGPLLQQLAPEGRLLAPIGEEPTHLVRRKRTSHGWLDEDLGACSFVPLRGSFGSIHPFDN
jgi:protein-L-isoaspartate(D-aspartate) O-methyltransferase